MFYKKNTQEVLKLLNTSLNGLSKDEADKRLKNHGYNELKEKYSISMFIPFDNFSLDYLNIIE